MSILHAFSNAHEYPFPQSFTLIQGDLVQQHRDPAVPRKNEKRKTFLPLFHFDSSCPIQNTLPISCISTKRRIKVCASSCNHL